MGNYDWGNLDEINQERRLIAIGLYSTAYFSVFIF